MASTNMGLTKVTNGLKAQKHIAQGNALGIRTYYFSLAL